MRVLVQRVKEARVAVEEKIVSEIKKGYLLFVGVEASDTGADAEWMAQKVRNLRIFDDAAGKLNWNLQQAGGCVLSVSQFTLCADMTKGNRPGFDGSAKPEQANDLWGRFNRLLRERGVSVQEGVFGAHMEVTLLNDGPVTIWLDSYPSPRSPAGRLGGG